MIQGLGAAYRKYKCKELHYTPNKKNKENEENGQEPKSNENGKEVENRENVETREQGDVSKRERRRSCGRLRILSRFKG